MIAQIYGWCDSFMMSIFPTIITFQYKKSMPDVRWLLSEILKSCRAKKNMSLLQSFMSKLFISSSALSYYIFFIFALSFSSPALAGVGCHMDQIPRTTSFTLSSSNSTLSFSPSPDKGYIAPLLRGSIVGVRTGEHPFPASNS